MSTEYILFTDIDGTLLNARNQLSAANLNALKSLKNVVRVAITGRNLYSAKQVLPAHTPIDYLIFSNGAGIWDWQHGRLIYSQNLSPELTLRLTEFLVAQGVSFTLHEPIPDSHVYQYHVGFFVPSDFFRRNELYARFVKRLNEPKAKKAACIICMLSPWERDFDRLARQLERFAAEISITRTTSPINHRNIWLEIYPSSVNKGKSAEYLSRLLSIERSRTIGVGNDYNDVSLLQFVAYPYVVENAPESLKRRFAVLPHHDDDAIARLIELFNPI